jgi:hypothetical protein
MSNFKLSWVCLTGTGLGQWVPLDESFETEEQARAVLEGHGPAPRAWWEVRLLRKKGNIYLNVDEKVRKRKVAETELSLASRAA